MFKFHLNDKHSIFYKLLRKDYFVPIHTRKLQFFTTKLYKLALAAYFSLKQFKNFMYFAYITFTAYRL